MKSQAHHRLSQSEPSANPQVPFELWSSSHHFTVACEKEWQALNAIEEHCRSFSGRMIRLSGRRYKDGHFCLSFVIADVSAEAARNLVNILAALDGTNDVSVEHIFAPIKMGKMR